MPCQRVGVRRIVGRAVDFLLKGNFLGAAPILANLRVTDIAHNGEKPGTAVGAAKPAKSSMRAQTGILNRVLGVLRIPQQPAGDVIGGIQVWQHKLFESLRLVRRGGFHKDDNAGGARIIPGAAGKDFYSWQAE